MFFIQFVMTHLPNEWQIVTAELALTCGGVCVTAKTSRIRLLIGHKCIQSRAVVPIWPTS